MLVARLLTRVGRGMSANGRDNFAVSFFDSENPGTEISDPALVACFHDVEHFVGLESSDRIPR